jgi:hypothetical protein
LGSEEPENSFNRVKTESACAWKSMGISIGRPWKVINSGSLTTERRSKMKAYMLAGIILVVIGIIAFAYQGITYTTRPIVGGIALVGGIVLLVMGNKKG